MRFLFEAHHPAHIHFWKYPIHELINAGHEVRMIARDRDVMKRLLGSYDWIPGFTPSRSNTNNQFPMREMLVRQFIVAREIVRFKPQVVASLMGSYCQSACLLGCRSIIFTDTETQNFNHKISHPFAHEIHTPKCFLKNLGSKQRRYEGIHELAFLDGRRFTPDENVLKKYDGLEAGHYVLVRLSAWNTLHDRNRQGIGDQVYHFVERFKDRYKIVISAEEGKVPPGLEDFAMNFDPADFHHFLAFAVFVLTEGASTSSEAACLGVPSVFVNSTEPLGPPLMLENEYGLVRSFQDGKQGVEHASQWLEKLGGEPNSVSRIARERLLSENLDVTNYVVETLLRNAK